MNTEVAARLSDIQFAYGPDQAVVIDIADLVIQRGEHVFVEGPSGCGKSTLLGLLGGVNVPQAGTLDILGQDLGQLSAKQRDRFRADHVGFVFQMFNLLPYLSVVENVTLACQFSKLRRKRLDDIGDTPLDRAKQILNSLGLAEVAQRRSSVTELSIGQQQRVAVARALIGAPEIIIADEPTSALDEAASARFINLLFSECDEHGTTLILVSHDSRLGQRFDRRIALSSINRATPQH